MTIEPDEIIYPPEGWNDLPRPTRAECPPAWDDMSGIERAMFVYRWRREHGHLDGTGDPLLDAGFTIERYLPKKAASLPEDCSMCGMPKDGRERDEYGNPQCWSWRASMCGECPYEQGDV